MLVPDSWGSLEEANPCHEPAGSTKGGQFCKRAEEMGAMGWPKLMPPEVGRQAMGPKRFDYPAFTTPWAREPKPKSKLPKPKSKKHPPGWFRDLTAPH